jgi:hypothetical protein
VLPPARPPLPSASGGFRALRGVWERWLCMRWCRLGPSVSRVRFPATSSRRRRRRQRIRSSRTRPRPGGPPLRRRRWARGGGVPCRGSLYRSRRPVEHRSGWMVRSPALCFKDKAALRCAVARRVERIRPYHCGFRHRWRIWLQDGWNSGCCPGRCGTGVCLHLIHVGECLLRLFQKPSCDGVPSVPGLLAWWRMMSGDGRQLRCLEDLVCRGSKDFLVIFCFLGASVLLLSSISFWYAPVCVRICGALSLT